MYCADDETTNDRKREALEWGGTRKDGTCWPGLCIVSNPATSRRETTFLLLARGAKAPCVPMFHFDRREARRGSTCAGKRGGRGGRRGGVGRLSSAGELVGENYASVRTSWRNIYLAELIACPPVGRIPLRSNCGEKE